MNKEQFTALMPYIVSELVSLIAANDHISEKSAMEKLYCSKLYECLEREELKLWHYSGYMLYSLFCQEQETGNFEFPQI